MEVEQVDSELVVDYQFLEVYQLLLVLEVRGVLVLVESDQMVQIQFFLQ